MADAALFISMSLALLLTPGPTNTLLLVGGATNGLKRSLWLPPAEMLGYLAAIHILAFSIGSLVQQSPVAQLTVRLVLALYLAWLALRLWRSPQASVPEQVVTAGRVFVVTLLNPKALIFAFIVVPPLDGGRWAAAVPYLAGLCGLILAASLCWIGLGAAIRSGRVVTIEPKIIRRLGSAVLIAFAVVIGFPMI
jgi:threonine/homoserine/homoserine lactone efflux protein